MLERVGEGTFGYLGLLARAKAALDAAVEVAVPADAVRRYEDQPRKHFDEDAIRRLCESIDASGQTTAGIIRHAPGTTEYELIDGERRWRAVRLIPADRRPLYRARLIAADDDVVQFLISGVANFNREGHTPLETCDTIARLVGFEFPMSEIAAILGVSEHWAYQIYGLRKLVPAVKALLDPGRSARERLPVTAAIEIAKCDPRLHQSLAERVLRREVTLVGLRAEVVRASRAAGTEIRTRRLTEPSQQWRRFRNQLGAVVRATRDMQLVLNAEGINPFVEARAADEVEKIETQLRAVCVALETALTRIGQLRKGG